MLKLAASLSASHPQAATVAESDLALLQANEGIVRVHSDSPQPQTIRFEPEKSEPILLTIPANTPEAHQLKLPAGKYRVRVDQPPADLRLSSSNMNLLPAGQIVIRATIAAKSADRQR